MSAWLGPGLAAAAPPALTHWTEALRSVYQQLGSRLQVQRRETELTALLAALGALLIVGASALSVLWFGRIV